MIWPLLVFGLSFAQDSVQLETIQVRGTKEEKNYLQNSESVLILQEKDLPAQGRENNLQILNGIPNVEVNKNGDSFSIRGINNTGVTGFQKDNLSSVIIDDVFQTDMALQSGSFDLWDMDRVEILRGAQSTSQGVNSLAGSVLLDHRKAAHAPEAAVRLGFGNFGHQDAALNFNRGVTESSALRLNLSREMNDGYIKNIQTGKKDWGGWDKQRAGFEYLYQISEKDSIRVNGRHQRHDQGGTYTQGSDPFKYRVDEDVDAETETTNSQFSVRYLKAISDRSQNTLVLASSESFQKALSDADGTNQNTAGTRFEKHRDRFYSLENRFVTKTETWSNLFGVHAHEFNLKDKYDFKLLYPVGAIVTPVQIYQDVDRSRKIVSLFNSFTSELGEGKSFTLGLRAEHSDSEYGTTVQGSRTESVPPYDAAIDTYLGQVSGSYKGLKSNLVWLPKASLIKVVDNNHFGATYSRGYRTAGVSINRRRAQAISYNPEFTDNFELSFKRISNDVEISANVFYTDWQKQQAQIQMSNDPFDTQVDNAARSALYGAEVEAKWKEIKLGAGYVDTEFKKFRSSTTDYKGKEFPYASHWTARLSHDFKATDNLSFLSVLRYVSESYSNAENTRRVDPQFYLNLGGKYAAGSWLWEAYVNNVLDGKFQLFDGRPTSTTSPYQASYHQTSAPRELGARVSYFW